MERRFKSCVKYLAYVSYLKLSIRFCISTIYHWDNKKCRLPGVSKVCWLLLTKWNSVNVHIKCYWLRSIFPSSSTWGQVIVAERATENGHIGFFFLSTYSSGNQTLPKKIKIKNQKTAILFVSIVNSQKCTTTNIVEKSTCICTNVIYSPDRCYRKLAVAYVSSTRLWTYIFFLSSLTFQNTF